MRFLYLEIRDRETPMGLRGEQMASHDAPLRPSELGVVVQ